MPPQHCVQRRIAEVDPGRGHRSLYVGELDDAARDPEDGGIPASAFGSSRRAQRDADGNGETAAVQTSQ